MADLLEAYGLPVLFLIITLESAGVPLPGETILIAASILAARGHLEIVPVLLLSALAAILGDNIGYWVGRLGGRPLFTRSRMLSRYAGRVLPPAERFFARHGGKTVFLARFVSGLRAAAALMAGISRMEWWRFLVWNAAGGVVWAAVIGLAAFQLARLAHASAGRVGLVLLGLGSLVALVWALSLRRVRPGPPESRPAGAAADPVASARAIRSRRARRPKRLML
jgi:membrane protein DedA with SNARE-associated domain